MIRQLSRVLSLKLEDAQVCFTDHWKIMASSRYTTTFSY